MTKDTPKDPRQAARDEELERQQVVKDAIAKNDADQRKAAEAALEEQRRYETTGIRTVEGKP